MKMINRRNALVLAGGSAVLAASATAGAAAADSSPDQAAAGWKRLVIVTANIGRKHSGQRERAIRDVRNAVTIGGRRTKPFVGWQEIRADDGDSKEPQWINHHFGSKYQTIYEWYKSPVHQIPMSIPSGYKVLERRVTFCHDGEPDISPSRYIAQALVARIDTPKLRFVFANTHYIAGAWDGEDDPREKWIDAVWRKHFRKHRQVLAYWRNRGFPVIWTGDVNRRRMPQLLPKYEKRAFAKGIDQIGWVRGTNGTQLRLKRTKSVPMHVDGHNARVAIMEIRHV